MDNIGFYIRMGIGIALVVGAYFLWSSGDAATLPEDALIGVTEAGAAHD